MEKFVTGVEDTYITWDVELEWQIRRKLMKIDAVDGAEIDTTKILDALFPECIKSWSPCEATWTTEEGREEAFWTLPLWHQHQLVILVASYLLTGINQSVELDASGQPIIDEPEESDVEAEEVPLSSVSPDSVTSSTPTETG